MKHLALAVTVLLVLACGNGQAPEAGSEPMSSPASPASPESAAPASPSQSSPQPSMNATDGTVPAGDGVAIAYTRTGDGRPALVFIHGWMCNQSFWLPQMAAFAPNHTVVTVDLPGHGRSGTDREGWPLMDFGDDVRRVIDQLELDRVILVGHSMGAPVALETARLMPDRIIGVVAVDSLKNVDWQLEPEQKAEFMATWERDYGATCASFVANMFPRSADPELVKRVHQDMCSAPATIGLPIMRQFMDYDLAAALAAVDVPVRCINSAATPTNLEANRAHHDDFDAVVMEGVGHFLMMERPEEFNQELAAAIAELSGE